MLRATSQCLIGTVEVVRIGVIIDRGSDASGVGSKILDVDLVRLPAVGRVLDIAGVGVDLERIDSELIYNLVNVLRLDISEIRVARYGVHAVRRLASPVLPRLIGCAGEDRDVGGGGEETGGAEQKWDQRCLDVHELHWIRRSA